MKVKIYTDGACSGNPGPGGWAMVFNTDTECQTHSGYDTSTTNNRMELTAVIETLLKILECGNKDDVYEIYSDSAYVVNAIVSEWLPRWKNSGWKTKSGDDIKNKNLWKKADDCLNKLKEDGYTYKFIKVKGHAGNTFNELVDGLARKESVKAQSILRK